MLTVRASSAWRNLRQQLSPQKSPARCCAAREDALALVGRDAQAADRTAHEKAQSIERRLASRRPDRPSHEAAVQSELVVRAAVEHVARVHGADVAEEMRLPYAAETHRDPRGTR